MHSTKPEENDVAWNFIPSQAKILLVKPHWLWGSTHEASPPMGLLYLSSSLKNRFPGIKTRLLDLRIEKDKNKSLGDMIHHWKPDIVGFLCLTGDQPILLELSNIAKQVNPQVHVCCGGPYPTHCPEDFQDMPHVDAIVRGEGEISFGNLVDCLSKGPQANPPQPEGFSIRDSKGQLSIPPYGPLISDLDTIPLPDWDLMDIDLYAQLIQINILLAGKRFMPVFTSRGCPFHCVYCHNMFGKKVRLRSPKNIVDEIELLVKKYTVDEIQIYDDIFNIDRSRVFEICDLIIDRKLKIKISFPNAIRGDMADDEMILKLKQAGAYMITFAIETASPRLQTYIQKNLNIDKTIRAIRFANSIGLITRAYFMIGFPTETIDEIKRTIRLPARLPLTTISFFSVIPFKGTVLYTMARKNISERGRHRLDQPHASFFAPTTYYSDVTGIHLRKYILISYFMFFTPLRLFRYFLKIPRKILYLKQVRLILQMGFSSGRKKLP
ncbi:MAG: B12-binding domain-containing radical SAM protein [Proteobacteria bacterium]|nr:B12-binding domain-containing radical SAM protein [Pseudomonadota bacterium]